VPDDVFVGGRRHRYEISNEELLRPTGPAPEFAEDIAQTRERASKTIRKIKDQKTIFEPHRLIGRLLEEDNKRREKQQASSYPYSWDKPLFEAQ